jgi:hypothetical protein
MRPAALPVQQYKHSATGSDPFCWTERIIAPPPPSPIMGEQPENHELDDCNPPFIPLDHHAPSTLPSIDLQHHHAHGSHKLPNRIQHSTFTRERQVTVHEFTHAIKTVILVVFHFEFPQTSSGAHSPSTVKQPELEAESQGYEYVEMYSLFLSSLCNDF